MNSRTLLFVFVVLALFSGSASAQWGRVFGSTGGGGTFVGGTLTAPLILSAANTLCSESLALTWTGDENTGLQRSAADTVTWCLNGAAALTLSGSAATYAVGAVFSGVTTDVTAASGEDVLIKGGASSGSVQLQSPDNFTEVLDPSGTVRGRIGTRDGQAEFYLQQGTTGGVTLFSSASVVSGAAGAVADGSSVFTVAENINSSNGSSTALVRVTGGAVIIPTPMTAMAIVGTPDVTRQPMSAGSSCRMSAASAGQSWTPSETNAVTGSFICCTNTGTNDITMADSDGVYEGPGSVVGQFDTVCFEYVTDRWVERSFSNNEP